MWSDAPRIPSQDSGREMLPLFWVTMPANKEELEPSVLVRPFLWYVVDLSIIKRTWTQSVRIFSWCVRSYNVVFVRSKNSAPWYAFQIKFRGPRLDLDFGNYFPRT